MSRMRCIAGSNRGAALAGMSLSDYLLAEIRQVAERPTLRARLRGRAETALDVSPAEALADFPMERFPHDLLLPCVWDRETI